VIPTQIFHDRNREESFRHEGFVGKQDIVVAPERPGTKNWPEQAHDRTGFRRLFPVTLRAVYAFR